jgi:hypothetical protein
MLSFERELIRFKENVNKAEEAIKGPDIFWRKADEDLNEIRIMRRWNSHTPSITNVIGGGYYLHWKKKGTVIDPGYSFIKLFRQQTNYNLMDIDMLIVTHDHTDHCNDLAALITLFRQFNKWAVKKGIKGYPRSWDMLTSYGVEDQFSTLFNNSDNNPFLFRQRILINLKSEIASIVNIPDFLQQAKMDNLLLNGSYQESFFLHISKTFEEKYFYKLEVLPAYHKELFGSSTSFGLKITLKNNEPTSNDLAVIVISGDTASYDKIYDENGRFLAECYSHADLLILHVGSIEKPEDNHYKGEHLGLQGVVDILSYIYRKGPPKLVVLTEWGYEFGRLGLNGRTNFTSFVAKELNNKGFSKYYAAVQMPELGIPTEFPIYGIPIIPADISLRIQLPNFEIRALKDSNEIWANYNLIYAKESLERIDYFGI